MGSHVVDSFRDLHDALSAPVGGLKGNDRKVAGGKRSESRQRQLCGTIEKDEVIMVTNVGNEIDEG